MERAEAIKHVKEDVDLSLFPEVKEALETLIPELKESEEERVRKDIVGLIKFALEDGSAVSPGSHTTKEEALAYLEKQKDHFRDDTKMVEQKPAEVDESTKRLNDNWMKQHFDDYEEQKPAQSREEILHQLFQNGSISLSDYLYLTGEQKPAEWSEEDEKMLNRIINDYENGDEYWFKAQCSTPFRSKINWLKSLCPQWRPSEEQMEVLLWCTAHLGGADHRVLAELYEHLKKL